MALGAGAARITFLELRQLYQRVQQHAPQWAQTKPGGGYILELLQLLQQHQLRADQARAAGVQPGQIAPPLNFFYLHDLTPTERDTIEWARNLGL